jgi:hypothetical protein
MMRNSEKTIGNLIEKQWTCSVTRTIYLEEDKSNTMDILFVKKTTIYLIILLVLSLLSCYTYSSTGDSCPVCYGTGKCNYCFGTGYTREDGKCGVCGGNGKCIACGGSGIYRRVIVPWPVY